MITCTPSALANVGGFDRTSFERDASTCDATLRNLEWLGASASMAPLHRKLERRAFGIVT